MADFVKVAKKSEIPTDTAYHAEINGKDVALFRVGEEVHAIYSVCPHQGGPLHEGGLDGNLVMCPWHGWQFDVTNGTCSFNDAIKVPTFPVKEQDGDIYVKI